MREEASCSRKRHTRLREDVHGATTLPSPIHVSQHMYLCGFTRDYLLLGSASSKDSTSSVVSDCVSGLCLSSHSSTSGSLLSCGTPPLRPKKSSVCKPLTEAAWRFFMPMPLALASRIDSRTGTIAASLHASLISLPDIPALSLTIMSRLKLAGLGSSFVSRRVRANIERRCELFGRWTGNFLGMRRRMASSISCIRFVAPRIHMRWGSPPELADVRPSQCVMNLCQFSNVFSMLVM